MTLTVGDLRVALIGLPDELPVRLEAWDGKHQAFAPLTEAVDLRPGRLVLVGDVEVAGRGA